MEAGGDGSQGPGARSSGDPNEQEVLSARPSPSEPGLASESEEEKRGEMTRNKRARTRIVGFTRHFEAPWGESGSFVDEISRTVYKERSKMRRISDE